MPRRYQTIHDQRCLEIMRICIARYLLLKRRNHAPLFQTDTTTSLTPSMPFLEVRQILSPTELDAQAVWNSVISVQTGHLPDESSLCTNFS